MISRRPEFPRVSEDGTDLPPGDLACRGHGHSRACHLRRALFRFLDLDRVAWTVDRLQPGFARALLSCTEGGARQDQQYLSHWQVRFLEPVPTGGARQKRRNDQGTQGGDLQPQGLLSDSQQVAADQGKRQRAEGERATDGAADD